MIIDIIEKYVRDACKSDNNIFGYNIYEQHICVVSYYANELAKILGADPEIVQLSAYLHDISAIHDINSIKEHNIIGSNIAEDILIQNEYPIERVQKVKQCILSHSKPIKLAEASLEEICLSNADAMSKITNPEYWLYFAYSIRRRSFEEGRNWYIKTIDTNWEEIIEAAKELIKDKYSSVKILLC